MKRCWPVGLVLLLAGCGIQPSGVRTAGEAPAGLAPGVTLYFIDANGELRPQTRRTGRLGTIPEALALLLTGPGGFAPGDADLRTEIAPTSVKRVGVTTTPGVIHLITPLTVKDVTPRGIDQIVCTALGVHVQSGGSGDMRVRVGFVQPTPESDRLRTCPLTI